MKLTQAEIHVIIVVIILALGALVAGYLWTPGPAPKTKESLAAKMYGSPISQKFLAPHEFGKQQRTPFHDEGRDVFEQPLDEGGVRTGLNPGEIVQGENYLRYNKMNNYTIATQNRAIQEGPYALRGQEAKRYKAY